MVALLVTCKCPKPKYGRIILTIPNPNHCKSEQNGNVIGKPNRDHWFTKHVLYSSPHCIPFVPGILNPFFLASSIHLRPSLPLPLQPWPRVSIVPKIISASGRWPSSAAWRTSVRASSNFFSSYNSFPSANSALGYFLPTALRQYSSA